MGKFFTGKEGGECGDGPAINLRSMCGLSSLFPYDNPNPSSDDAIPKMVILDIYFVPSEGHEEVTQANIELFVKEHGEGVLESTALED